MDNQTISHYVKPGNNQVIVTTDIGLVFVDMDVAYNRKFGITGIHEIMHELSQQSRDSTVVFLFRDGANLELTNARGIIQQTISELSLPADRCFVSYYDEQVHVPGTTVIWNGSLSAWARQTAVEIQHLPLSGHEFSHKFAVLFGRFSFHRMQIFQYMWENHDTVSVLSFNTAPHDVCYADRFAHQYQRQIQWAHKHMPVSLAGQPVSTNGMSYQTSLPAMADIYQKYFLEVVCETDATCNCFFTEKTLKNFWLGKPFLLWSAPGSLKFLQRHGFQTFGQFVDESYDQIQNSHDRFQAVTQEIQRLSSMSVSELSEIHRNLAPVYEHNRSIMAEYIAGLR